MVQFLFEREDPTTVVPGGRNDVPAPRGAELSGFAFERSPEKALERGLDVSPDEAAKARRLQVQTDTPTTIEDQAAAEKKQRLDAINSQIADDPATQRFLSNPANAEIAHDDVESLSSLSRTLGSIREFTDPFPLLRAFGSQLIETPFRVAQGLIELDRATRRTLSSGLRTTLEKIGLPELADGLEIESPLSFLQEGAEQVTEVGREAAQAIGPEEQTFGTQVAGALGQISAQMTAILLSGGVLGTTFLAGEGAALQADDIKATGESVEENPEAVIAGAAVTALTERFGLDLLFNRIPKSVQNKMFQVLAGAGTEASQEILEGVLQNLVALGIYDPDREVFDESLLEEGAVAGTAGSIISLIVPGRQRLQQQQILDEAAEVAQNSKLNERAPEALAEHVGSVLADAGVPEVYVPGMQLAQWVMNQPNPQEVLLGLGVQDSIQEAVSLGGDVTISGENFSRWVLQSPDYAGISQHIRMTEDGFTMAETEELAASGIREEVALMMDSFSDPAIEQDKDLTMAEALMGLRGLFTSADEAGMTPSQYQNYLAQVQRAAERGARNKEAADLRERERENTKEWRREFQAEQERVREHFSQLPVYSAFNGIGVDRLDRAKTEAILQNILQDDARQFPTRLEQLPKQKGNRAIYTPKGQAGLDPEVYAEMYGYPDAETMFTDMLTSTPFEQAVEVETQRVMRVKHDNLIEEKEAITAAKRALMTDEHAEMIAMELNALRFFQGQGRLKNSLVRQAAKEQLAKLKIKDIKPNKFLSQASRLAKEAGRALKRGDRPTAVDLKFKQLLNYHMAKEAMKLNDTMTRQRKYMAKFLRPRKAHRNMHPDHLTAIRQLLDNVNFGARLTEAKLDKLIKVARQSADPAGLVRKILDKAKKTNYQDMTYSDFRDLHNSVREIHHKGVTENKLRLETEERERDVIIAVLNEGVRNNLKASDPGSLDPSKWQQAKKFGKELMSSLFHVDTILREIDGFQDLGPAHENILGRYNKAMNGGYQPGQKGYIRREKEEAERIVKLYDIFTKKERNAMHTKVKVPGVNKKISRATVLSVLLNSGNQGNLDAMIKSGTFTEAEVKAIHDYASKKDWDFAQSVWDYFESFWPEIVKAEQRRRNTTPERVEPKSIDTQHGTYKGGYYPIRYNKGQSVFYSSEDAQTLIDQVRYGDHVASQTAHGHTKERVDNPDRNPLLLDLFVINSHVQRVAYDLEVGDAVIDLYKIIKHPDFRRTMIGQGQQHKLEALDTWLEAIITGEVGVNNAWEKGLRWLRTRATVVGLGWNIGVIALQALGLTQTAVVVGKKNTLKGMRILAGQGPKGWVGKNNIFDWIDSQSPFMASRSATWHKDIADAQTATRRTMLDKVTPGNTANIIRESFFYGIKKMQRMVDAITWLSAHQAGIERFNGDGQKAARYADDVVMRSQASGIWGHRTALERGQLGPGAKQRELVRAFTIFYSYFARKLNITIEQTKRTGQGIKANPWSTPYQALNWANDMALLFVWEALLAALIRGQFPDEGDDEEFFSFAAGEVASTVLATVPFAREVSSAVEGFSTGGTIGRVSNDLAKAIEQAGQGEVDEAFIKSMNNMGGLAFKYPSGQINKWIGTVAKAEEGEDVKMIEWLMGPHFDR